MSLNSNHNPLINPKDNIAIPSWVGQLRINRYEDATTMFNSDGWTFPFTNLDLFSLDGFSLQDIRQKIFKELGLKDSKNNEEKATVKLNRIYRESVSYLERVLYRKIPNGLKNKSWTSTSEFLGHLESHLKRDTSGLYSLMFCGIIKVMLVEVGLDENPAVSQLDADMVDLMAKFTRIPWMKVNKKSKKNDYQSYILDDIYEGKLEDRPKGADSIRTKLIYNRPYNTLEKFKDLQAMRLELDPSGGETGYVHTIRKIRDNLYWKNKKINFEIKWGILSPNAIQELEKVFIVVTIKKTKWWASLSYGDAKFVWGQVNISKPGKEKKYISPEIQFVLPNNKNESWFSSHRVYDLKKIISANARLFWALTIGNIQYILEHYKTEFDPRELLNHLLYPQWHGEKPFLQLIKTKSERTGRERVYFSTSDIYNEGKESMSDIYNFPKPKNLEWSASKSIQHIVHNAVDAIMRKRTNIHASPSIP